MKEYSFGNTHIYIKELPLEIEQLLLLCNNDIRGKVSMCKSMRRKREIIVSHLMVKDILGNEAMIDHDINGAPILVGVDGYISISHSTTDIAIAINPNHCIGIDIETWREQLIKVKERFLSQKEIIHYASPQLMLQAWTMKEALYKVAQSPGISLADDIMLPIEKDDDIAKVNTTKGMRDFEIHVIESTSSRCISLAYPLK